MAKVSEPHLYPSQPSEWGAWIGIRGIDVLIESWEARAHGFPVYRTGTRKEAIEWAQNTERMNPGLPRLQVVMSSLPLYSTVSEPDEYDSETGELVDHDDSPIIEVPVSASDESEIEPVIARIKKILAELASKVPYGDISSYQLTIFWREVLGSRTSRPKRSKLLVWGTSEFSDPNEAIKEFRTGLVEMLKRGTDAAQLRKYKKGGKAPSWIEIPKVGAKWVCGVCGPAAKEETEAYLKLTGKKATPRPRGRPRTKPPKKAKPKTTAKSKAKPSKK